MFIWHATRGVAMRDGALDRGYGLGTCSFLGGYAGWVLAIVLA